jgi:hypothetical protein
VVQDQPGKSRSKKSDPKKDRLDSQRSRTTSPLEKLSFAGTKAKWQPLFHRLIARVSGITGIEVIQRKGSIALALTSSGSRDLAEIRVKTTGLECRLALSKSQLRSPRLKTISKRGRSAMTHFATLKEPSDIDEEFLSWLKAARIEARTSTKKSS